MRIFRSKNAVEFMSNWLFWIMFIIAVGITTIIIVYIGNYFVIQAVEIPKNLEESTIILRFYNSKDCYWVMFYIHYKFSWLYSL